MIDDYLPKKIYYYLGIKTVTIQETISDGFID